MMEMEEVFFSGTFGGETLSLAAAIAVIDKIRKESVIERLWETGSYISREVTSRIKVNGLSNVIKLSGKPPWQVLNFYDYDDIDSAVIKTYYMVEMLKYGVLTIGSHNICYAHDDKDIEHVLNAYDKTLLSLSNNLFDGKILDKLPCPTISPVFNVRESVK